MGNILEKNWKMEEIRKTNSEKLGQNQDGNPYFNRKLPKSLNYLEYCKEAKSFLFWGQIWDDFPKKSWIQDKILKFWTINNPGLNILLPTGPESPKVHASIVFNNLLPHQIFAWVLSAHSASDLTQVKIKGQKVFLRLLYNTM